MTILYSAIIGYLLGSVNPAFIFGKMHGLDLRKEGTGNLGASNAKVVLGWKYFAMTVAYDVTKCILAMLIASRLLHGDAIAQAAAGCAAIWGHCYPFYLGFQGGKGFASMIGMIAFMDIKCALILLVLGIAGSFATNYIVFGTMTFAIGVPIYLYFIAHAPMEICAMTAVTSLMMIWKHKVNFEKLLRKEEMGINGKKIGIKLLKDKEETKE